MQKKIDTGTEQLLACFDRGIITLKLNNPRYKNALSENLTPYLRRILKKINKDSKYKLLVLKGVGDSFCSGGNIRGMNKKEKPESIEKKINNLTKKQKELTGELYNLKVPSIAAITGPAAGAGFSLALACDFRIGNKNSFFVSNYSKIGLSGDYGISWFLTNLLGEAKAKEIMMLNYRIYADEALKLGLLNFLFKSKLDANVSNICNEIVSQSSLAIRHIKNNIHAYRKNKLEKIFKIEARNLLECSYSNEHKLAVANFTKK